MKKYLFVFGLLFPLMSCAQEHTMDSYLWKNRLLLVFAPEAGHPSLVRQLEVWESHSSELEERDLLFWQVFPEETQGPEPRPYALALRKRYYIGPEKFVVILIGKDGGEKLRVDDFLPNESLFATIDAMPMRRREMGSD